MTWYKTDVITGEQTECGARIVTCMTDGCENYGIDIEVGDDGTMVICGPCNGILAVAAHLNIKGSAS